MWSPDGRRIAYSSTLEGKTKLFARPSSGRGEPELLLPETTAERLVPEDWSSDGKFLTYDSGLGKYDLWILPLDGGDPFPLVVGGGRRHLLESTVTPSQSGGGGSIRKRFSRAM